MLSEPLFTYRAVVAGRSRLLLHHLLVLFFSLPLNGIETRQLTSELFCCVQP